MSPLVRSVNVGCAEPNPAGGGATGIWKVPVPVIEVRAPGPRGSGLGSGVVGDLVANSRHHGGDDQAVYAVAREELDHWASVLDRELPDGTFGENLTTAGTDVDAALVGECWRVGGAVLQVRGPRIPCATFAARMGERGWVSRFADHGRTGAYLAVLEPGRISVGDGVEVLDRPGHGVDVPLVLRAFLGDMDATERVLAAGALAARPDAELRERAARRRNR